MSAPSASPIQIAGALILALALAHSFSVKLFERMARRSRRHAGVFHLLAEVEVVFGFWAGVLVLAIAALDGGQAALDYAESRTYTEPLFVLVVMVIAASRPIVQAVNALVDAVSRRSKAPALAAAWIGLTFVPLLGSVVTEPAAMTIAALVLAPRVFRPEVPERLKYLALGVLFVNVSIGGTLSAFAAPPVLMVAKTWGWTSHYMLLNFGWKAALAVFANGTLAAWCLRSSLSGGAPSLGSHGSAAQAGRVPLAVVLAHFGFLAAVILMAHHLVAFVGIFLLFLGFTQAYERFQSPLILREALLVAFFLAGLVVLGGLQQWWLQPVLSSLSPGSIFVGATALTAVTDNAALTYLGSQIAGLSIEARHGLMAGAVVGGGLTVIANAPNPAGGALLRKGFAEETIGAGGLFMGALVPTLVAGAALYGL